MKVIGVSIVDNSEYMGVSSSVERGDSYFHFFRANSESKSVFRKRRMARVHRFQDCTLSGSTRINNLSPRGSSRQVRLSPGLRSNCSTIHEGTVVRRDEDVVVARVRTVDVPVGKGSPKKDMVEGAYKVTYDVTNKFIYGEEHIGNTIGNKKVDRQRAEHSLPVRRHDSMSIEPQKDMDDKDNNISYTGNDLASQQIQTISYETNISTENFRLEQNHQPQTYPNLPVSRRHPLINFSCQQALGILTNFTNYDKQKIEMRPEKLPPSL